MHVATKRHLTSRIDRMDTKIDDCVDNTAATRDEVSEIRGKVRTFGEDVQSVHLVVQSLETKISRIEGRQNETNYGVGKLVAFVRSIETSRAKEQIEVRPSSSSRPALELPSVASSARAGSLPPSISVEPSSPSASSVSPKRPLHGAVSASGLKNRGAMRTLVLVVCMGIIFQASVLLFSQEAAVLCRVLSEMVHQSLKYIELFYGIYSRLMLLAEHSILPFFDG